MDRPARRSSYEVLHGRSNTAPSAEQLAKNNLLRRMRIVAKARFAASKRLDAKSAATNFGLQTANIYTIAIGIFLLQFDGSEVLSHHVKSLNFTSLIASVFVQIVALIESYKDFSGRAKSMHRCAVQVNRLFQRLEIDPRLDMQLLAQYQEQYSNIIDDHD